MSLPFFRVLVPAIGTALLASQQQQQQQQQQQLQQQQQQKHQPQQHETPVTGGGWRNLDKTQTLVDAALLGRVDAMDVLLEAGADVETKIEGETMLFFAIGHGLADMVEVLLKHGANVSAVTSYGYTPLMVAAFYGHTDIVAALLEAGADPNQVVDEGKFFALYIAAWQNQTAVADLLLASGANVNQITSEGLTALHVAYKKDMIELLIQKGADVNARYAMWLKLNIQRQSHTFL